MGAPTSNEPQNFPGAPGVTSIAPGPAFPTAGYVWTETQYGASWEPLGSGPAWTADGHGNASFQ